MFHNRDFQNQNGVIVDAISSIYLSSKYINGLDFNEFVNTI